MGKTFRRNKRKPIKLNLGSCNDEDVKRLIEIWKNSEE